MGTALRVEWLKVTTTRTWWVLLLVMVPYLAAIAGIVAAAASFAAEGQGPPTGDPSAVATFYTLAMALGYVFPALLGILAVTTEYRHRTVTSTLLAETRRPLVVAAKAVVAFALGLVYAVVGLVSTTGTAALVLLVAGEQTFLGDGEVLGAIARSGLGLALWALIGVGFGFVLRNQIAAIVTLLAFSQLVEPVLRLGLGAFEVTQGVARFLPGAAGDALGGSSLFTPPGSDANLLQPWQGGLVLLAYAVVLLVVGGRGFVRRDVA